MVDYDDLLELIDHYVQDMMFGLDPATPEGRARLDECEVNLTQALSVKPFPPGKTSIALRIQDNGNIEVGFK